MNIRNYPSSPYKRMVHLVPSHLEGFSIMLDRCISITPRPLLQSSNINTKPMMDFESTKFKETFPQSSNTMMSFTNR